MTLLDTRPSETVRESAIDRLDFTPAPTPPPVTRKTIIGRVIDAGYTEAVAVILVDTYVTTAKRFKTGQVRYRDSQGRRTYNLDLAEMTAHRAMNALIPDDTAAAPGSIHADLTKLADGVELTHVYRDDQCGYALAERN